MEMAAVAAGSGALQGEMSGAQLATSAGGAAEGAGATVERISAGEARGKPRNGKRKQQIQPQNQPNPHKKHENRRRQKKDGALRQPPTRDMPRVLSELLNEPKQALLHRVVRHVGPKHAWQLLKETLRLEKQGGQQVNALGSGTPGKFLVVDDASHELKARRRTSGGVFLALLKEQVPRETYKAIYEIEDKKKKEAKKRGRNRSREQMESTLAQLGFDELTVDADEVGKKAELDSELHDGDQNAAAADHDMEEGEL